jgi:hypothetical protein
LRTTLRNLAATCLVAFFSVNFKSSADAGPATFQSGIYEGLMLAVSLNGELEGFFREEQGEGVTKTCAFFLHGRAAGAATVPITTWNQQAFPGSLAPKADGVQLAIPQGRDHPGCGLVLLPAIAQGIMLDRTLRTTWSALERIAVRRAYLHARPADGHTLRTYTVQGDVVGITGRTSGWIRIELVSNEGGSVTGWIQETEARPLTPQEPAGQR